MKDRINEPIPAGQLFSLNIFGGIQENKPVVSRPSVNINSRPSREPQTRPLRTTFTELTDNSRPLTAVLPYLTNEAIAMTMDNYRLYVADYNEKIRLLNIEIDRHNVKVLTAKTKKPLTEVQVTYSAIFYKKNLDKLSKEYNLLADEFNANYGLVIEKKKFVKVKYATELVFQQMLHLYSKQLTMFSNEFIKIGISHPTTIRQFDTNSHHVTGLRRNGVNSIDVCNATIRNHRARLEECGVLCHYLSQGHTKGVKMHVNSQILVVFDAKNQLFVGAENQSVTPAGRKDFKDNNEITRTNKSNINNRENGQADFLDKERLTAGFSFDFYRNIPTQEKSSQTGGGENVKISKTLSEKLEDSIIHPLEFAKMLSAGAFFNHSRLDQRILYKEASYGTMSREDFKEVIVQEFFKNASKLWRNSNVYVGCWKKAYNSYIEKIFFVNTGSGINLNNKELMVDKLQELLWRINTAQKWFNKTKINPLFPSDYFDFTRLDKKEIGFEYTRKSYLNHLKYIETKPKLASSIKKKATLRSKNLTHTKKFDIALRKFFKNKIQLSELIEYVDTNLPAEFLQKLSDRLITISSTTKYTC